MSVRELFRPFVRSIAVFQTPLARLLCAGSLLAGALTSQVAPVAAQDLPDLQITGGGCCYIIRPGATDGVWLTVKNPAGVRKVFDPATRAWVPELYSVPASNVTLRAQLPAGWTYAGAQTDHGFTCSAAGFVVTCSGGAIAGDEQVHVIVMVTAPAGPLDVRMPLQATVDPNNALAERSETNNAGTASLVIGEPIG
jgi:hypothetical protein